VALAAQTIAALAFRRRIDAVLHTADAPARELQVLLQVVQRVEQHQFRSARLSMLASSFSADNVRASTAIRRLKRLVEMHDWEHNLAFTLVAAVLLWGTHIAWTIEAWRRRYGRRISDWLVAAGELEALLSLGAYCYEHPDDPFPEIVLEPAASHRGRPRATFDGTSLGHPLVPAVRMVRNDVRLSGDTRLLVVSGSNMSGKSTLLRTVGINAVLALSGAPVRAASLRLSPLALGATLRIQDSLQEGRSRFYAEITRIRMLAETASGPHPLLFLLDELFHGTNSHDRLVGARGVLQSLLERGAIGLVTTHDLALTEIARDLTPTVLNTHFDDWFEGGEIRFDYRVKPGPVTRSNALALMRAVGLDVPVTESPSGAP
jgi:DNA mismatch repair ATPase MutS